MIRVDDQTWKEMVDMYLKCDKQRLAEMLATRDSLEQNQMDRDPFNQDTLSLSQDFDELSNRGFIFPRSKGGFTDSSGQSVSTGDVVKHNIDGRVGILKEALQDGDAYVSFTDGSNGNVKWNNLEKVNVSSS